MLLVAGILLWSLTHLSIALAPQGRQKLIDALGLIPYKLAFSMVLVIALVLLVMGWRQMPPTSVWVPPAAMRHLTMLLVPIAGLYLVFTRHFGFDDAWSTELWAVLGFSLLGLLGMRFPLVLVLGYGLHGAWDVAHELHAHARVDAFGGLPVTLVPLAYGAACAGYDGYVAAYFWRLSRRPGRLTAMAS